MLEISLAGSRAGIGVSLIDKGYKSRKPAEASLRTTSRLIALLFFWFSFALLILFFFRFISPLCVYVCVCAERNDGTGKARFKCRIMPPHFPLLRPLGDFFSPTWTPVCALKRAEIGTVFSASLPCPKP